MSRLLIALLVSATLTVTAQAESSLKEQYRDASRIFLAGSETFAAYQDGYRKAVMTGIDGTWAPLSMLFPGKESDEVVTRNACEKAGLRIKAKGEFSFLATRNRGKDRQVDTVFNALGGNLFSQSTDPDQTLRFLGLDKFTPPEGMVPQALGISGGSVTIIRPSPDILVFQLNYRQPEIYGRCPA